MPELVPTIVEMRALPEFRIQATSDTEAWQEHVEAWRTHQESLWAHYWMLGAIAASLTRRYGENDVRRFAHEVQCSTALVYERAATHRAWQELEPDPTLSYSHHIEAAKFPDPQAALERARMRTTAPGRCEPRGRKSLTNRTRVNRSPYRRPKF